MEKRNKTQPSILRSLQDKLSVYAMAAGAAGVSALALSQPVEGEVVYTGAHEQINRDQSFAIDLNHDGVPDFTIQNSFHKTTGGSYFQLAIGVKPNVAVGGEVLYQNHPYMAAALQKGAVIGARGPFEPTQFAEMAGVFRFEDEGTYSFGYWNGSAYLGFRFKIDGEVHYGWARLTVAFNTKFNGFARLTGYAYETEPNTPITAGDMGEAESDSEPFSTVEPQNQSSLGALALGASGLSISRR